MPTAEQQKRWRDKHREASRAAGRKHYQAGKSDPVRYAAYLEQRRLSQSERLERDAAKTAVKIALRSGRLVNPGVCSRCPSTKRVQAHHPSYEISQRLVVIWLCECCHVEEHRKLRSTCLPSERTRQ